VCLTMRAWTGPSAGTAECGPRSLRLRNEHYDYCLRLNDDVRQYRPVRHPLGLDPAESGMHSEQADVGPKWRSLRKEAVASGGWWPRSKWVGTGSGSP
jgi:hypothetical protein